MPIKAENLKRDKTKQPKKINMGFETYKLPEDIQAALNIISQFNKEKKAQGRKLPYEKLPYDSQLSFAHADFSDYSLERMDFSDAIFINANLSGHNI